MNKLLEYLPYIITLVNFVLYLVIFLCTKRIKGSKKLTENERKELTSKVETLQSLQEVLVNVVPQAIELAEKSGAMTPEAKKLIAMSQVMLQCSKQGLSFTEYQDKISDTIENDIMLTKRVNVSA